MNVDIGTDTNIDVGINADIDTDIDKRKPLISGVLLGCERKIMNNISETGVKN